MKKINHKLFAVLSGLLLLVCCVRSAQAQPAPGAAPPPQQPDEERRRPRQPREAATQPLNSVRVEIRQSASGTSAGAGPTSCEAFTVDFTMNIPPPSGVLIPVVREPNMRESGGYYVCDFLIPGLPPNQEITVNAGLGEPNSPTPSGWQRQIQDGRRAVTLTESEPRASLSFEMVYVQVGDLVRPPPARNRLFQQP